MVIKTNNLLTFCVSKYLHFNYLHHPSLDSSVDTIAIFTCVLIIKTSTNFLVTRMFYVRFPFLKPFHCLCFLRRQRLSAYASKRSRLNCSSLLSRLAHVGSFYHNRGSISVSLYFEFRSSVWKFLTSYHDCFGHRVLRLRPKHFRSLTVYNLRLPIWRSFQP